MDQPPARLEPRQSSVALLEHLQWVRPWERHALPPGLSVADAAALAAARERLSGFAAQLNARERVTLQALVDLATGEAPFRELAALPPEAVLTPQEQAYLRRLEAEPVPEPGLRPLVSVVMKGTRLCNLRCTYCNYWREGPNQVMPFPVLARAIRDTLCSPRVVNAEFVWHGGEPTLLPIAFYRKALWLQQRYRRPGQVIKNRVQTNATRLSDDWISFWQRYRFIVGVSLDGPPEVHDRRRVDRRGRPTAAHVRAGLRRLQAAGLDPRLYIVIDDVVIEAGSARILEYLLEVGAQRVGLLNAVPAYAAPDEPLVGTYLPWPRYLAFLGDLFRLWWPRYADRIVLRELADLAGQLAGRPPLICNFAGDCFGNVFTIEPSGEISACDRYLDDPNYLFGNLLRTRLGDVETSPQMSAIRAANQALVTGSRSCPWFAVCHGGCPHDRGLGTHHVPGFPTDCCGLAPLLAEMAAVLRATGVPLAHDLMSAHQQPRPPSP